jgi:A/G-specific adenine glycosylase
MKQITDQQIKKLQKKVLAYYTEKGRDLPWRKTTDPYKILVSEIMLQQTQVDRVIPFYENWLHQWPTVADLSAADSKMVMKAWNGLGYNRRARYLQETAKKIHEEYNDDVLEAMNHPKELPGIGPYTSQAVQIFAANKDIATVDTNIRRIFIHAFGIDEKTTDKELQQLADRCVPKGKSRDWHNALMDYGATLLTSRKTGIKPKTTQTKFEGSDRQIRGEIVRQLMDDEKDLTEIINNINEENKRVESIIDQMKKEQVIFEKKGKLTL